MRCRALADSKVSARIGGSLKQQRADDNVLAGWLAGSGCLVLGVVQVGGHCPAALAHTAQHVPPTTRHSDSSGSKWRRVNDTVAIHSEQGASQVGSENPAGPGSDGLLRSAFWPACSWPLADSCHGLRSSRLSEAQPASAFRWWTDASGPPID
jgi:hypothetical protein